MATLIPLPIIRAKADLQEALARLDVLIDAPDGSPGADERMALSDLIAAYEDRHPAISREGARAILRRLIATHGVSERALPEIGPQSVVSAVLLGKRSISARMALGPIQAIPPPRGCVSQPGLRPTAGSAPCIRAAVG